MSGLRSVSDRFWAGRSWPLWKHLVVAGCVLVALGALVSPVATQRTGLSAPSATITAMTSVSPTTTAPSDLAMSTTSTRTPMAADPGSALTILLTIPVEKEHSTGYSRDLFAVWSDLDGDGCDTRQEVLIVESVTPPQIDPFRCHVVAGEWVSVYDGRTTADPAEFDVDHLVALKEAWDSGAWQWSADRRIAFANDLTDHRTLVAVSATSNQSKGDADPSNWLPPAGDRCRYIAEWIAVKARWSMSMDESEHGRIRNLLKGECGELVIDPWSSPPS